MLEQRILIMGQFVRKGTTHRELIQICRSSLRLQKKLLGQISLMTNEPRTELVRRLILSQFCMTCFQNLRGADRAFREGDNYIPNVLCRNVIEYYITWKYIDKDPVKRIPQFAEAPLKSQLTFSKILERTIEKQPHFIDIDPERIKDRTAQLEGQIDDGVEKHGKWSKILEQRAGDVGLGDLYNMPYRLLSTIVHPDALQSENYFIEAKEGTVTITTFRDIGENAQRSIGLGFRLANEMFSQLAETFDLPIQEQFQELTERIENWTRREANIT